MVRQVDRLTDGMHKDRQMDVQTEGQKSTENNKLMERLTKETDRQIIGQTD